MVDDTQRALVTLRALNGDMGRLQMWFEREVLDRYRGQAGVRVIRTDSAGRVRSQAWSLDFGISDNDRLIHASVADLSQRLPEAERDHWSRHISGPPASRNFLLMRFGGGGCIDDGEIRDWS
ncbi:MAG TPA: hypothetical protein VMW62_16715 [Chloroflexota bacterium]|nr:hypothetical protein [Chloroflexota bacterium]